MRNKMSKETDGYYIARAKDLTNLLFDKGFLNVKLTRESINWLEDFLGFTLQSYCDMAAKCAVLTANMKGKQTSKQDD